MFEDRLAFDGGKPVRTRPFGPTHEFGDADVAAVAEVIRSGDVAKGPKIASSRARSPPTRARYGVSVLRTSAMHTCVAAITRSGDEIIVTPWTSGGSLIGVLLHNCVPVFADIDDTYNLDPRDVEAKITPRTRAIIAVHLFGNPCDMDALRGSPGGTELSDRGLLPGPLREPRRARRLARWATSPGFSFGGKHLSAGMGGCVLTSDPILWERALLFSDAALSRRYRRR